MIDAVLIKKCLPVIIMILVILVLVVTYVKFDYKYDKEEFGRQKRIDMTINWLYNATNNICYQCDMFPVYKIKETFDITYSEKAKSDNSIKGTIYLVIWDKIEGKIFNNNTLLYAVIHEISHILSPSSKHNPPFDNIERLLLEKAEELGYYDSKIPIDKNYLTVES